MEPPAFRNPPLFRVRENQGNESAQKLPVFSSVLFLQEFGTSFKMFRNVGLSWSVLRSGGEKILWYKWDRSELMILLCPVLKIGLRPRPKSKLRLWTQSPGS